MSCLNSPNSLAYTFMHVHHRNKKLEIYAVGFYVTLSKVFNRTHPCLFRYGHPVYLVEPQSLPAALREAQRAGI